MCSVESNKEEKEKQPPLPFWTSARASHPRNNKKYQHEVPLAATETRQCNMCSGGKKYRRRRKKEPHTRHFGQA